MCNPINAFNLAGQCRSGIGLAVYVVSCCGRLGLVLSGPLRRVWVQLVTATRGLAWLAWYGPQRSGMFGFVLLWLVTEGSGRRGVAWLCQVGPVAFRLGWFWLGRSGAAWIVQAWQRPVRYGSVRLALEGSVVVWQASSGQVRSGLMWLCVARYGLAGLAWSCQVWLRPARVGVLRLGMACPGLAGAVECVWVRYG